MADLRLAYYPTLESKMNSKLKLSVFLLVVFAMSTGFTWSTPNSFTVDTGATKTAVPSADLIACGDDEVDDDDKSNAEHACGGDEGDDDDKSNAEHACGGDEGDDDDKSNAEHACGGDEGDDDDKSNAEHACGGDEGDDDDSKGVSA